MSRSYNPNHILHSAKSDTEKRRNHEEFKKAAFEPDAAELEETHGLDCDNLDFGKVGTKMKHVLSNAEVNLILKSNEEDAGMAPFLREILEYCEEFHHLDEIEKSKSLRTEVLNRLDFDIGYDALAAENDPDANLSRTMDSLSDHERKRKLLETKLHPYEIATLINTIHPNQRTNEILTLLPSLENLDGKERFQPSQIRDVLRNMKEHLGYEVDSDYNSDDDESFNEEFDDEPESGNYIKKEEINETQYGDEYSDEEDLKYPPVHDSTRDETEDGMQMETGNSYDDDDD